jgi:hypothetical protein
MTAKLDVEINLAVNEKIWFALEKAAEHSGLARLAICASCPGRKTGS